MKISIPIIFIYLFTCSLISCGNNDYSNDKNISVLKTINENFYTDSVQLEYLSFSKNNFLSADTKIELNFDEKIETDEIFIIKYDNSGIKKWSEKLRIKDFDSGVSLTVDSRSNIYITGYDKVEEEVKSMVPVLYSMFLTKYNSYGIREWSKNLGESFFNSGIGLIVDSFDNIYVAGFRDRFFNKEVNSGNGINFLTKYNSDGTKLWTRKLELFSSRIILDLNVDSSNNIFLTGLTKNNFDETLTNQSDEMIVFIYNSDGVLL